MCHRVSESLQVQFTQELCFTLKEDRHHKLQQCGDCDPPLWSMRPVYPRGPAEVDGAWAWVRKEWNDDDGIVAPVAAPRNTVPT